MATATKTAIEIEFYAGNLVSGSDMTGLNTKATIDAYKAEIAAALPQYDVTFKTHRGEGPEERVYIDGQRLDVDDPAYAEIQGVTEMVFNRGTFWVNTTFINCTEDSISRGVLADTLGAATLELIGTYSHPDHEGESEWNISLYEFDLDGYKGRVFSTNGDPVWEDGDSSLFAETLEEYHVA